MIQKRRLVISRTVWTPESGVRDSGFGDPRHMRRLHRTLDTKMSRLVFEPNFQLFHNLRCRLSEKKTVLRFNPVTIVSVCPDL